MSTEEKNADLGGDKKFRTAKCDLMKINVEWTGKIPVPCSNFYSKMKSLGRIMPVILATWEAEIRIQVQDQP
jgi:hypothetical protein